jgi:hypothetical protein
MANENIVHLRLFLMIHSAKQSLFGPMMFFPAILPSSRQNCLRAVIWQTRLRRRPPPRSPGRGARRSPNLFAVPVGHRVQWQEEAKSRHTIRRPSRTRTYSTGHHAGKKEASRDDRKTCRGRKQGARPAREKEVRGKRDGSAKKRMEIAMAKSRPRQGGMASFH